jgi:hypothetical protein
MAGDEGNRACELAVGEWDLGTSRGGNGGRDAGDDFVGNTGGPQSVALFGGAAEDERVAPLEPHDRLALLCGVEDGLKDEGPTLRMIAGKLADAAALGGRGGEIEQPRWYELIVKNEVRPRQTFDGPQRQ